MKTGRQTGSGQELQTTRHPVSHSHRALPVTNAATRSECTLRSQLPAHTHEYTERRLQEADGVLVVPVEQIVETTKQG